jgi:hypothetical protein
MVNLDKWEKVEHTDVKVGDRLKVVVVTKGLSPAETTEVYKGKVTLVSRPLISAYDIYLSDGSVWENVANDDEECTVYRRKAKPFKLPTELGAIISGRRNSRYFGTDTERVFLVFDGGDWSTADNAHNPSTIEDTFTDLRVERKGIKQ